MKLMIHPRRHVYTPRYTYKRYRIIRINATALYIYVYTLHTYTRTPTHAYVHAHVDPFPTLAGPLAVFRTFAVHYNTNITT